MFGGGALETRDKDEWGRVLWLHKGNGAASFTQQGVASHAAARWLETLFSYLTRTTGPALHAKRGSQHQAASELPWKVISVASDRKDR